MKQEFNFRVVPCEYHNVYCPTICETEQELVAFFEWEPTIEEVL